MHTRRPARLKQLSYLGRPRYSLTFCTDWKRKWFTNASAVDVVLSQFLRVSGKEGFAILVYCFMPDHVHLLIEGLRSDSDAESSSSRASNVPHMPMRRRSGSGYGSRSAMNMC